MNCTSFVSLAVASLRNSVARRLYGSGKRILTVFLCLFFLTMGSRLFAQTFYGSISGVVKDPSGAVVSGAAVTVHESTTATEYKTVTNKAGVYRVSFLKPGGYTVRFEKDGFAQYATDVLNIVLNQDLVVDGSLKLGATSEVVTVTGAASSLNDTNSQIGGQLSSQELIDLPETTSTKGANEFLLTKTFAGVSNNSSSQDYGNINDVSLGGGRTGSNPIIIDGLPSNMGIDGTYGLIPTPDSTEELQVLISPFSAQYGQSGGGAILTTTKSGTNNFHGTAFESYSSQSLNALGFFTAPNAIIQPSYFHYFGGSVGGPVILPKLLNGRSRRLYFFTDWEYTLNHANAPFNTTVPTAAELTGDFSGLSPTGQPTSPIYDPLTAKVVGGKAVRTQFPGNIIPQARLDQVGKNIAAFFPAPNCTPTPTFQFNYCSVPISASSYLYNADRVDYNASDYDHIWAKFSRDGPRNQPTIDIPNAANTSAYNGWTDDHYEVSWSHIFSPRLSNEARAGYVSEVNFATPPTTDAASIGLQGVQLTSFPSIKTTQYASFGPGGFSRTRDGHYILNDAMVMQVGRHTLSIGGEFMRYAYSSYKPGVLSGSYTFSGTFSAVPGQTGYGVADMLLGLPSATTISTTNTVYHYNLNYFAGYLQDDYRITSRLTLNLGLRYEFDGPAVEEHNNYYSFNPSIIDPTTGKQGGIEFAGFNGPHQLTPNTWTGVLPRVGFNYRIFRNTVVRGGYGIYQLPSIGFNALSSTSTSTVNATFASADGVTPPYQLSNGVPAYSPNVGPNGEPLIPSSLTKPSSSPVQLQLTAVLPYMQEWQFGMQQDLGHNWIAELNYMGDHGVHLPIVLPANQIAPAPGCCFNVSNAMSLRPYPQFLAVYNVTNGGAQAYAALFATLTHRWSNGVSVNAAYTWAHLLNDVDGGTLTPQIQNYYNLHAQWGTAKTSVPQRLSVSAVYALPMGSGGRFLNDTPVLSQVIGHWKISTVAQFQMGIPYSVTQGDSLNLNSPLPGQFVTQTGNGSIPRGSRTLARWFNTKAFQITPQNTLGNGQRASFFGPGLNMWDMSLMRDIPLREHTAFTLRVDAHNVFNHPQFSGLNTGISTSTLLNNTFGTVTGAQDSRSLLLVGRFRF